MKKAVIVGERKAELVDAPEPKAKEDWVVVKVHAAPMCTEYKSFVKGNKGEFLGHEASGEVVEVAQPGKVQVGDRVVVMPLYACGKCALCISGDYIHCRHSINFREFIGSPEGSATMAQYLVKPSWMLPKIPDGMSYDHGSLACCALAPSFGAMQRMRLSAFDTILITGIGPVGLGATVNALFRNARVIAMESEPWRVDRAKQMGVERVIDPRDENALKQVMDLTGGVGVDCALDCSGNVKAERFCIDATRRRGQVAFIGECGDDLAIRISPDMIRTGLTLIGSWHYNMNDVPHLMKVIQRSPLIDLLISHVMPMSKIQEAFEISASRECAKIILKPWE